jgi:hypothetical protein
VRHAGGCGGPGGVWGRVSVVWRVWPVSSGVGGTRLGGGVRWGSCVCVWGLHTGRARLLPRARLRSPPPRPPPTRRAAPPPPCPQQCHRHRLLHSWLRLLLRRHLLPHQFHPSRHHRRRAAPTVCTAARLPHHAQRTAARGRRARPRATTKTKASPRRRQRQRRVGRRRHAALTACADCTGSAGRTGCAPPPG